MKELQHLVPLVLILFAFLQTTSSEGGYHPTGAKELDTTPIQSYDTNVIELDDTKVSNGWCGSHSAEQSSLSNTVGRFSIDGIVTTAPTYEELYLCDCAFVITLGIDDIDHANVVGHG